MNDPPLLPQALRLLRRELRGGLRGFGVFLTCLFLGVFAISAIGSFTESAKSGLLADASALLGGDLEIRQAYRILPDEILAYLSKRGELSHVVTMRTMVSDQNGTRRTLGELKAVDATYPLYGQIISDPRQAFDQVLSGGHEYGALVDQALLARLKVNVGDLVRVGAVDFRIRGVILSEPDRAVQAFSLGPRFMISLEGLSATDLVQPGSLVYHAYRVRLPDRQTADQLKEDLQAHFPEEGWRLRTWREAAPRVRFFLDRMNLNLTLIGLCALLVGGLGISGAVRGYLGGKINHIATMKCLGASGKLVFTAYLLQVMFLGAIGSAAGLFCGAALPYLLKSLIGPQLPIPLAPAVHWQVLFTSAMFGLLIALAFSLKALGIAKRVPPGILFRGYSDNIELNPGNGIRLAIVLVVLLLAALAIVSSSDTRLAGWFIFGASLCFGIFRLAASSLVRMVRFLPKPANPSLRLGIANIHRRGSPARHALFSLGLGLTALIIIMLVQANLGDMVDETIPSEAPSFFFLDLQPGQIARFDEIARNLTGITSVKRYPTLRGRITSIAGVPVDKARIDQSVRWAVRGDRYLSYAAEMPPGTKLVSGKWWPENYRGDPQVSITADIAKGFGVVVGDTLTVNILGREVTAKIASLREVDWTTLDLNFAIIFSPGVLENAPQTYIATIRVPPSEEDAAFAAITGEFANVSAIGTREVLKNVSQALDRIGMAFKGMATIALLTGFLVMAGAVSADQHRRIHDAVIYKVCGATRFNVIAAFAAEFLLLGLIAGAISAVIGSLSSLGILRGLMNMSFTLHPGIILITIVLGVVLTLLLGLLGTWKALGQRPAAYLREE